ncbi:MAG: ice-binding family protein [Candidatus Delongbacteria bacterium]|jgi:hypothetical protein|nr:ice-binding family protein [Candidatus Delongbacteria bacterium]
MKKLISNRFFKLPLLLFVLAMMSFLGGCSDDDGSLDPTDSVAPTVISVMPIDDATEISINSKVTATFSETMDVSTITTETFKVTDPTTTTVAGTVTYVGTTATFIPTSNLADSTLFTVTITTGAKDLAGNAIATNFVWTFTTGSDVTIPHQTTIQETVILSSNDNFVILAGSLISNIPTSAITGNIGLSPAAGSYITGFGALEVTGTIYTTDATGPAGSVVDATGLTAAKGDLTIAYNDAAGRTSTDMVLLAGNIGGLTLTPGLYKSSGSLEISSGDLTFDAEGNADAVFIIQIASTLTTTSGRKIILSGNAQAENIFWQVGTSAVLGSNSTFKGIIMADQSISLNTGASVEGKLLARIAAVTIDASTVINP